MLRRLRSLQEQCRSKTSLLERPFCNIGQTSGCSVGFQPNSVDALSRASTPKENSGQLPASCVNTLVPCSEDLPTVTVMSMKRTCSEIDDNVDQVTSVTSLSPPAKRSRQDTAESVGSENGAVPPIATACSSSHAVAVPATEKASAVAVSPTEKSFDSINVELSSSAVCEMSAASNASVRRSGSYTQLTSFSRPASVVRSANSSPRTWPSRRDLGQCFMMPAIIHDRFH